MKENANSKDIHVWIDKETHNKLVNDFLTDDSNRILGAKLRKSGAVDLGLKLLFQARKTQTLEEIYMSVNGIGSEK